jgi:hypothetical protein
MEGSSFLCQTLQRCPATRNEAPPGASCQERLQALCEQLKSRQPLFGVAARCGLGRHRKDRGGIREGAVKPGHRRHLECGGSRRARPDGGMVCRSRALRAREPPRSKRWCQRRCDRGVWARDPGVCCADAPSLRRGAETSRASTSFGWVENTCRVAERRQGLEAVQPPPAGWHRDFNGARCASVTARPSETTCRSPDVGVRRLRRALGTALDSSDCTAPLRRLRGLLPPGCEVSHLVECRAPPAGRQRPPVGGAGRSHDKVVESWPTEEPVL